jgi:hypothetical protein
MPIESVWDDLLATTASVLGAGLVERYASG